MSKTTFNENRRNKIINGAMALAQRGLSISYNNETKYCLDRFQYSESGQATITREALAIGDIDNRKIKHFMRINKTSSVAISTITHKVEFVETNSGLGCVISFYAKALANVSGTLKATQKFGSGGSLDVEFLNEAIAITTAWQRFEFYVPVPSILGKTIGSGDYIDISLDLPDSTYQVDLTGFMFSEGEPNLEFDHAGKSFKEELELAQRYFEKSYDLDVDPNTVNALGGLICAGRYSSDNTVFEFQRWIVPKRVAPIVTAYNKAGGASSITASDIGQFGCHWGGSATSFAWHYVADAEL